MMNWSIKPFSALTSLELYQILKLRSEVFVVEQDCVYQDIDDKDYESYHVCGFNEMGLMAYARIVKPGVSYAEISIGRVVVSPKMRGVRLGVDLMVETIRLLEVECGKRPIRISAQSHLKKYYNDLGFIPTGKEYLEDGIPHMEMLRD